MNNQHRHPLVAFLLSFFPGGGQFYCGNIFRGMFYFFMTVLPAGGGLFLTVIGNNINFLLLGGAVGFFFYLVSFIDTLVVSTRQYHQAMEQGEGSEQLESERFFTIVLSFIPGVGHFQLGLMNRGFTFLTAFLGAAIMIFFVSFLMRQDAFLVFMAFLPVVWVYSFFDSVQHLNKKQRGETLEDRSLLDDLENRRADGQKSKVIATLLAIFPGAGHLYLGYQRRGIQLMAAFLLAIYVLDILRLGVFIFLIPIIWFYSFFDGLQKASREDEEPIDDQPIIPYLMNHKRWIGIGFIVLGGYFLLDRVFIPSFAPRLTELLQVEVGMWYHQYFHIFVVSLILIAGGVKLLSGSKMKGNDGA
ncbi:hypothetical protein LGQ02_01630 [Bacillus shivajii]|uniref:hypothetical protein n=1 Tax=Bacillus shivajii TaxID=1983719 RepID=UPI001CFA0BDB|nr:hypothetical protein [Bacillus shivajii]UCZ53527.1 hypothetical protein LGQ02_01630 [Bacillus shivajii]